ncbi:WD repeat-containing protein 74 [Ahaetulla prasina]|uniref:WD repeat-containing protein 74 n=1 Tax=Ahaetulla prasina TaxID=499056 RepID=UPI0026493C19|nr:WD repeat-containing protein 74 [Ahaetulla prasina]XP_058016758.1 WD repeat-containing protein 74 [Ahaetulla prasina]
MASPSRGSHVWVGSETGILKGVNLQKKQATNYRMGETTLSRREAVTAMCWGDSYESEILVGCLDGSVRLFSTEKGKFIESRDCQGGEGSFCGLAVLDGSLITCVESGLMKIWRDSSSENVEIQVGPGVCRMRQNSEQRHRVATGGKENCLKIWDLHQPQEPVFRAKNVRHDWLDLRVPIWDRDMEFLPGSEKIVTCTGHHQVRVYDPSCPQRRPVLEVTFGEYPLTALSLTSDANAAVVGSSHGDVAVIDLRQGRLVKCLKGFAGSVRAIQCHPTLPVVASCGLDRFLRLHNLQSQRLEHKVYLKSRLNCLLLTSREKWESEALDPSLNLQEEVKEEDDELWNSMEVVASKRKVDADLGSRMENPKPLKDPNAQKQQQKKKMMKKIKLCSR